MAGLYIHIPFCRKICSYCDFYKTTQSVLIPDYLEALEMELRQKETYLNGEVLETIYFGGGTPSLIGVGQLAHLFEKILRYFHLATDCEVTLEANPDDLKPDYLIGLRGMTPVNRLSIGIQSFNDADLKLLNRRHTAAQAIQSVKDAKHAGFNNITIDLIYGLPGMKSSSWEKNLELAFSQEIQHLSAYHLTIEPNTSMARMTARGLIHLPAEQESSEQFKILNQLSGERGFIHYEISNLAREGFMSKHNSNYWMQKKYIGLGPSAHSFNLVSRQWNTSNAKRYMEALSLGGTFSESEVLDVKTRYNEYLMLSLRTMWGLKVSEIRDQFGEPYVALFEKSIKSGLSSSWILDQGNSVRLTPAGWMVSDFIISGLMVD
jgi:oxygen-independent coproporphyrinogen III oxidase